MDGIGIVGNKVILLIGVGLVVLGGSICSIAGMTFRPDVDADDYEEKMQDKNQLSSFIFMMGSAILQTGLLLTLVFIMFIMVNSTYPVGVRITAGIIGSVLIPFFLFVFVISGPLRLAFNALEGGL